MDKTAKTNALTKEGKRNAWLAALRKNGIAAWGARKYEGIIRASGKARKKLALKRGQ